VWILKNFKYLLGNLNSRTFSTISSIQTFDFSALYTAIPREQNMLKETIHNAFYFKNGSQRDKFVLAAQMK
jgi:hypothetical protein